MDQEEQNRWCKNNSGGSDGGSAAATDGESSKNLKEKKVPRRGPGIAQLEMLRLGEPQNEEASLLSSTSPISRRASNSSSSGVQGGISFRPNPSSLIPFLNPSPLSQSPPNSNFRPSTNFLQPNTVLLPKPVRDFWQDNWPNYEYNLEGQKKRRVEHQGQTFGSSVNFPYESIPIWPSPGVMQRTQQFQHPSSSMVNVSSRGSSSSSVINYPLMENLFAPMRLAEEKNVEMKRPYPFALGNPSVPPFPGKFSPTHFSPFARADKKSASSSVDLRNPVFRDPTRSNIRSESNPNMVAGNTADLSGDFLTLGITTTAFPHSSSKYDDHSSSQELSEFGSQPYQGSAEGPICDPEPSRSTQQQPFYNFIPPATTPTTEEETTSSSCSEKVGENVDLNLKL
ncbi:hypothetical protein NMG60_11003372 [Bertholletia excelsa]